LRRFYQALKAIRRCKPGREMDHRYFVVCLGSTVPSNEASKGASSCLRHFYTSQTPSFSRHIWILD
jgi:hypothetical protein